MDVSGKRITVVGMGRSAMGAVELLLAKGAIPFVTECRDDGDLAPYRETLEALGVAYEVGGHTEHAFEEADWLVLSPGVPASAEMVVRFAERGLPVLGELELAWGCCASKVLAVTGTNGKTTTTELLRAMIAACGHLVALAGNNKTPFSSAVLASPPPEYIVLEVSSYQLETAAAFHPWIATVLNVTPDHLGRHQSMERYAETKNRIFARQGMGDVAVVNADDEWAAKMGVPDDARRVAFSLNEWSVDGLWVDCGRICEGDETVAPLADNPLPGKHNLHNVLAALAMVRAGGFDWERCLGALRSFRGVEHRIEYVARVAGVDYYNDSKSTNIDSLRVALESFEQPVVLIAGGRGKGAGYESLRELVSAHVKKLVTLGEEAPRFEAAFSGLAATSRASTMTEAVGLAQEAASQGDVVLLSPGCASFDMYRNFEERGCDYKTCVTALTQPEKRGT